MSQVKETLNGFFVALGVYAAIVEIVGVFFSEDILSYTLGLLFGVAVAIFLIIHMAKTLDKALDLSETQASKYVKKQSFLRLFIMLIAMIIALNVEVLYFVTVVLGMLGLKIGALAAPFFLRKLYPESFVTKENDEIQD